MKKTMLVATMVFMCLSFTSAGAMRQVANQDCPKQKCEKCAKMSAYKDKCKEGKDACKAECKKYKEACKSHNEACKSECKKHKESCKSGCKKQN